MLIAKETVRMDGVIHSIGGILVFRSVLISLLTSMARGLVPNNESTTGKVNASQYRSETQ